MKNIFRGIGLLMIPLTYSFPQRLFIYWITNSLYAICQVRLLRTSWARRVFSIPDANNPDALRMLQAKTTDSKLQIIPNRPYKVSNAQ
jgi:membrane protein insertase Oxa1/YidC/SpoIIIJ